MFTGNKFQTNMNKQSKLFLKRQPTLKDFQQYVRDLVEDCGFENDNIPEIFMLLNENIKNPNISHQ